MRLQTVFSIFINNFIHECLHAVPHARTCLVQYLCNDPVTYCRVTATSTPHLGSTCKFVYW